MAARERAPSESNASQLAVEPVAVDANDTLAVAAPSATSAALQRAPEPTAPEREPPSRVKESVAPPPVASVVEPELAPLPSTAIALELPIAASDASATRLPQAAVTADERATAVSPEAPPPSDPAQALVRDLTGVERAVPLGSAAANEQETSARSEAGSATSPSAAHGALERAEPDRVRVLEPKAPESPPPADPERAEEILRQVRLSLSTLREEAVLQLEPRSLGRIAVRLSLERGTLDATLEVESASTLAVLQHHAPELRAMLELRGLKPEHLGFQLGFQNGGRGADTPRRPRAQRGASAIENTASVHASGLLRALAAHGIDTYA